MSNGERGVWPQHIGEKLKKVTVIRTMDNAVNRVVRRIPLGNPFEVNSELEQTVYMGVERIARLPDGVNHLYWTLVAFKDVSILLSFSKSGQELREKVRTIKGAVPQSILDAAFRRQKDYEIRMHEAIDQGLDNVITNPQDFPNENVRKIIQEYLRARELAKSTSV